MLARSSPLLPLKNLSAKAVTEQQGMSKRLFDGVALSGDNLAESVGRAQQRLDRRAADAAKQATMIADIHLRDQLRERQRLAGESLSPDLRHDPDFRAAARAYTPPPAPSRPERGASRTEPAYTGPEPSVLRNLSLVDVPPPTAVPAGGVSRGSIVDDVKAALTNLGVNVMGRSSWRPRYGHDAEAHTPMKVTVHHSAGSPSHSDANVLGQIAGWEKDHVKKGFGRMGYHWVINSLGTVVEGQGMELVGSHTRNNNRGNIGICLAGNYDKQAPSEKMIASLVGLTAYVGARYSMDTGSPDFVRGHEHYVRKSCPGNNVMSMLRPIREKAVELVLAQKKEKPGNGAFVVAAVTN
ncbi:MAG: peptidoglycan recognition protein family protein [Elusimicrobiota bacterium]|nr:MAG: peptidoglycan recognition protein family protein [Elusimicrobiota bacterium]